MVCLFVWLCGCLVLFGLFMMVPTCLFAYLSVCLAVLFCLFCFVFVGVFSLLHHLFICCLCRCLALLISPVFVVSDFVCLLFACSLV